MLRFRGWVLAREVHSVVVADHALLRVESDDALATGGAREALPELRLRCERESGAEQSESELAGGHRQRTVRWKPNADT